MDDGKSINSTICDALLALN